MERRNKPHRRSPESRLAGPEVDLLDAPERRQLTDLARRMGGGSTTPEGVGSVLPQAVVIRNRLDAQLPKSFVETTEKAIQYSVERDSSVLSDALFVVIGPAIRKAIATFLREMTQTINRAVERTISPKSLGWRIRAVRTHQSFAEIVLRETLVYRVEHVFLIHRTTGTLLAEATTRDSLVRDSDMVSGMLSAVQDFMRDSLNLGKPESLQSIAVGRFSILAEASPHAVLAAVVQGTPPPELRFGMQDVLETVHLRHAEDLSGFRGDTTPFAGVPPILEGCLRKQYRDAGHRFPAFFAVVAAIPLVALLVLLGLGIYRNAGYSRFIGLLEREPGIVVVRTSRRAGRLHVYGLRDPMARDPLGLAEEAGIRADSVELALSPYNALLDTFVLERARAILKPPASVTLSLDGGILRAEGQADARWVEESRNLALAISGIGGYESSVSSVDNEPRVRELRAGIEGTSLLFAANATEILPGQEEVVGALADRIRELDELARERGTTLLVTASGHSAGMYADAESYSLSEQRATRAVAELRSRGLDSVRFEEDTAGVCDPSGPERTEAERARNRRVSFTVTTDAYSR